MGASVPRPRSRELPAAPRAAERNPSLGAVFRAHSARVARLASRLGGPRIEVEDVVQDVFLVLARREPVFENEAALAAWLGRTTAHVVRNHRRRAWFRRVLLGAEEPVSSYPSALETIERRRATAVVYEILDAMPERHRVPFVLFELEGMSGEEIAAITGARVGTVWVRLHRARAEFAARLARRKP